MRPVLLITDDPARSSDLNLGTASQIHYLDAKLPDDTNPAMLISDVPDLNPSNVQRLRRLLAELRCSGPLLVLLRWDTQYARLQALTLGASQIISVPSDNDLAENTLDALDAYVNPIPFVVDRRAREASNFLTNLFVADRPITPVFIDDGAEILTTAINEAGIRDWIRAIRQFDDSTHQHCLLVAGLAAAFAVRLGLGARERHRLTRAALLHDVGKIHVPASILNKPDKLSPAETALMRLHPTRGEAMLAGQGFEAELLAVVRSHHEMLDGSGYPDALVGDEIPDLVRLVTVCDIFGALIEHRPYKPPMAVDAAYTVLIGMIGRLDRTLVEAFRSTAVACTSGSTNDSNIVL